MEFVDNGLKEIQIAIEKTGVCLPIKHAQKLQISNKTTHVVRRIQISTIHYCSLCDSAESKIRVNKFLVNTSRKNCTYVISSYLPNLPILFNSAKSLLP